MLGESQHGGINDLNCEIQETGLCYDLLPSVHLLRASLSSTVSLGGVNPDGPTTSPLNLQFVLGWSQAGGGERGGGG